MTRRLLPVWMLNGVTVTLGLILVQYSIRFVAGPGAAQAAIAMAVCASLADVVTTTDRVARRVLAAALASVAAAALFYAVRPYGVAAWIPTAALIVLGAMLLMSWGPKAAPVAFAANLSLVFAMSVPTSQPVGWDRVAWGLVGSAGYWVWAVATAHLLQRRWRVLAIASTAEAMAALFSAIGKQFSRPAEPRWQSGIVDAEASLAERFQATRDFVFKRSKGPAADLETMTLLHLIDLRDLAIASNLDAARLHVRPTSSIRTTIIAQIMEAIAGALRVIAEHLRTGIAPVSDPGIEESLHDLVAELEEPDVREASAGTLGVSDILRSKLKLLSDLQNLLRSRQIAGLPCRRDDLERYITPDEWRLGAVRANLRPDAPVFRHAIRTSVTAVSAYALARALPWAWHPQWVLLTVVAVMQGSLAQTLLRRNARVLGTLVGCVVSSLLLMSSSSAFIGFSFLVAAGVAHAFFGVQYAVTAAAAAVMGITQVHLLEHAGALSGVERLGDTLAGAIFGWLATYVLPTWERSQLAKTLREAVDAIRAYARVATNSDDSTGLPRFARQRAYDAIRAVEATRARSLREPAGVRVPMPELVRWLSDAYGLMSQLSNLRLTLTMHAEGQNNPAVTQAIAAASLELDQLLGAYPKSVQQAPILGLDHENALAQVPDLLPRMQRALNVAFELATQSSRLDALLGVHSPEQHSDEA